MLRTFFGSVLFVACMAVAWGSADFFLSVPHLIIAASALSAPFVVPQYSSSAQKYGPIAQQRLRFLIPALFSTVGVGFLLPFLAGRGWGLIQFSEKIRYLGVLIFLSGYLIRVLATRKLRKQFSFVLTIQENRQLITSGIYSVIRHPVYLGNMLGVLGMFLVFSTWYSLIFVIFYMLLLGRQISQDEKHLMQNFGSVYEEYSTKSFRLIPHIY